MERSTHWRTCVGSAALVLAVSAPGSLAAAEPRNQAPPSVVAKLDALIARSTSSTSPGCAVGVRSKGAEVLRAYGLADLERHVGNSIESVFNIASVSKQFTAAAVLLLANEGKLALDDDVRRFLPELSELQRPITVDDLLSHTSGLRDFRFTDWVLGRDTLAQSNQDVLAYASRQRALNHAPGESHLYSNTGYVLLAIIVERVSGQTFQDFTRERLFEPAGMVHTHWETDSQRVVDKRASGYALVEPAEGGKPARFGQMPTARNTYGHGNLLTTVADVQQWNAALSRNAFGPELTAQLEKPARLRNGFVLGYARGEFVGTYRGLREVQHGGYNGNYTAWVGRYPDVDLSVSMLCNSDNDDIHPHDLVDLFLPKDAPPREPASKVTAGHTIDLSVHNGVYRRADAGQLALFTFPKAAKTGVNGYVRGPDAYRFESRRPGRVMRRAYGNTSEWLRLPGWTPSPAELALFQGRFSSDELLGTFDVTFDGQQLGLAVLGLSDIRASLQPRAPDVFEARGVPNLDGLLVVFKRERTGRIIGLAVAPDSLHELPFRKLVTN